MSPLQTAGLRHRWGQAAAVIAVVTLIAATGTVHARTQQNRTLDGLVVRCSTVNTSGLPQASLAMYEIEPDADRGLLSCVVQSETSPPRPDNVRAAVQAQYHGIGQAPEDIEIRQVRENDLVTYLGTYRVPGEHPLVFEVSVEVAGAGTVELSLTDRNPRL